MNRKVVLLGILSSIFGGAFGAEVLPATIAVEEGFIDLDLPIAELKRQADGTVTIVARGKVDGSIVGLIVDILPTWNGKDVEEGGPTFYWGKARYRSLGEESDRFLALLAKHYEIKPTENRMAQRIDVTAVGLNDNPERVMEVAIKMKFFLAEDSEENHSEVFTNVDAKNRILQFHEKDPEYRQSLLHVLSGGT